MRIALSRRDISYQNAPCYCGHGQGKRDHYGPWEMWQDLLFITI